MGLNRCDTDKAKIAHKPGLWVIWDTGCRRPWRLIVTQYGVGGVKL